MEICGGMKCVDIQTVEVEIYSSVEETMTFVEGVENCNRVVEVENNSDMVEKVKLIVEGTYSNPKVATMVC